MAAASWQTSMAALYERRTGPRKVELEAALSPATQWNPALPGLHPGPRENRFVRSHPGSKPLPASDEGHRLLPRRAAFALDSKSLAHSERRRALPRPAARHPWGWQNAKARSTPRPSCASFSEDLLDTAEHSHHLWRDRLARGHQEMARVMSYVDLLLVPSLRDETLTPTNFTGHPSLTFRAGFVEVSQARSDWAPDPANPLPKFNPPVAYLME